MTLDSHYNPSWYDVATNGCYDGAIFVSLSGSDEQCAHLTNHHLHLHTHCCLSHNHNYQYGQDYHLSIGLSLQNY